MRASERSARAIFSRRPPDRILIAAEYSAGADSQMRTHKCGFACAAGGRLSVEREMLQLRTDCLAYVPFAARGLSGVCKCRMFAGCPICAVYPTFAFARPVRFFRHSKIICRAQIVRRARIILARQSVFFCANCAARARRTARPAAVAPRSAGGHRLRGGLVVPAGNVYVSQIERAFFAERGDDHHRRLARRLRLVLRRV